jgi:hypothetical protein
MEPSSKDKSTPEQKKDESSSASTSTKVVPKSPATGITSSVNSNLVLSSIPVSEQVGSIAQTMFASVGAALDQPSRQVAFDAAYALIESQSS